MSDDIRKLQQDLAELMKRVRPKARYRLREIHDRLAELLDHPAARSHDAPAPYDGAGKRAAA